MTFTLVLILLTTMIGLASESRARALAAGFYTVVAIHIFIHVAPRWLGFSVISRMISTGLKRVDETPASSILAMLAAGFVGWLAAGLLRAMFQEPHDPNWDPDRPRRLRRASRPF